MGLSWLLGDRGGHQSARPRSRNLRCELTILEDRQLLAVTAITASAGPPLMFPPNGRYVPIVVSGSITQVVAYNLPHPETTAPTPKQMVTIKQAFAEQSIPNALISVTDQYREDEPESTNITLQQTGDHIFFNPTTQYTAQAVEGEIRTFTYSRVIYLQAKVGSYANGRQYAIDVYAADSAGGISANAFTYVPRHINPRLAT